MNTECQKKKTSLKDNPGTREKAKGRGRKISLGSRRRVDCVCSSVHENDIERTPLVDEQRL